MTPGEICYQVSWLATIVPCVAIPQRISCAPLKRLILMTYTTKVMLPQSHWEVYWLAFLCKRGAVFLTQTFPFYLNSIAILGIFWLSRWNWSIGCFQNYYWRAFLPSYLEKSILIPIWVVFQSFCQVWFNVHIACQFLSSKLSTLVTSLLIQHGLVCFQYILALIPILQHLFPAVSGLALGKIQIVSQKQSEKIVIANKQLYFAFQSHFSITIATPLSSCYSRGAFS